MYRLAFIHSFTPGLDSSIWPWPLTERPLWKTTWIISGPRDLFEGRTTDGRTDRPTICRIYTILTNNTHKREKQQLQQLKMFYHVHVYHVYYVLSCYCACLIKHLMLQYSINHWIELKQKKESKKICNKHKKMKSGNKHGETKCYYG